SYSVFFFFFQAEDGIRDLIVTGVQTCALPICNGIDALANPHTERGDAVADSAPAHLPDERGEDARARAAERVAEGDRAAVHVQRSEERRVGKEWRSRGAPDDRKRRKRRRRKGW